jgi:nicotinamidase-related amidase
MKAIFLLDVDTQTDLVSPSGTLTVPGADRLISKFKKLFDFARKHEIFVLSTANTYQPGDSGPAGYPAHCIAKTPGQRKIEETLFHRPLLLENKPIDRNLFEAIQKNRQIIVEKQAFDPFTNPVMDKILRALPPHAIVLGVPLDLSVKQTCLGLRRLGIKTALVTDAARALVPSEADRTLSDLRKAGAEFITLEMLLGLQERS